MERLLGLVHVDRARVWSRPEEAPALVGAAVSAETARWCAGWADGLVTVNQPLDALRSVLDAYRSAGGQGTAWLQVHLAYASDEGAARAIAHDQWRNGAIGPPACWDTDSVGAFDAMTRLVRPGAGGGGGGRRGGGGAALFPRRSEPAPLADPGEYNVTLTVGGQTLTQKLRVIRGPAAPVR